MAQPVTCKLCKSKGEKEVMFKFIKEGSKRGEYFCNEMEFKQYQKLQEEKQRQKEYESIEKSKFHEVDVYIADKILGYEVGQIVPPNLKKRIKKLRQHYEYEVILHCLVNLQKQLSYYIQSKEFEDENHMVNYVMIVVENNINDAYKNYKRIKEIESKQVKLSKQIVHVEMPVQNIQPKKSTNKGISAFLKEDDF